MIVTICASARFRAEVHVLSACLEEAGFAVLLPPLHDMSSFAGKDFEVAALAWKGATLAHFDRIAKADVVLMLNPDSYLGVSATLELGVAHARGKLIVAAEDDADEPARAALFDWVIGSSEPAEVAATLAKRLGSRP
jgi:nucleoside 2-deoxyribosyltransferase